MEALSLRAHPLDGALLLFDRVSGWNVRASGPSVAHLRRRAPRVVHLGLSSSCNLACSYCHRDRGAPSRWTLETALAWLKTLSEGGVLEVVFGEGEPLTVPWFPELVRRVHEETALGVGFTTNGTLLTRALHDALEGRYGQLRLSLHDDRRDLAKVRALSRWGARFGVNLLVTPERLRSLDETLSALVSEGCHDVLALSYNGPDEALHLRPHEDRALSETLQRFHARHGERVSLKVSTCFGRRLSGLPTHLPPGDCGAGEDFLSLDSAWRLRPCSFHHGLTQVRSPEEALSWWRARRAEREPALLRGCARPDRGDTATAPSLLAWRQWASNNSSSFLLVGEFSTEARAARYVSDVEALCDRAEKYPERTVGALLSQLGVPTYPLFAQSARELTFDGRPSLAQRGTRVIASRDTTLSGFWDLPRLLLVRHGRILFLSRDYRQRWPSLLVGVEGSAVMETLLRASLGGNTVFHGGRAWNELSGWEYDSVRARLGPFQTLRAGFAPFFPVGLREEPLAEAVREPIFSDPEGPRELLVVRAWGDTSYLVSRVEELVRDPVGYLEARGWPHPFRLPKVLGVHALPGQLVLELQGRASNALQWALGADGSGCEVLDARALRAVIAWPSSFDARRARRCADGALGLARPGERSLRSDDDPEDDGPVRVDLCVRELAPLASLLRRQSRGMERPSLVLAPERPRAVAAGSVLEGLSRADE